MKCSCSLPPFILILLVSVSATAPAHAVEFPLYGGANSLDGKFENADGEPDWQGWISLDHTESTQPWHVSTFNAANLGDAGAGNHAMWAGQEMVGHWLTPPGYGNDWNTFLEWRSGPLVDPSQGQTVVLEFYFNHDTEVGYDFFMVEYDLGGATEVVASEYGSNKTGSVFPAPGVRYPDDVTTSSITYAGNDYAGPGSDEIVLRLRVLSDAWASDEDGGWPTDGGAVQVDAITVTYDDGGPVTVTEDFEGTAPYAWTAGIELDYEGDYAKIFSDLTDIDPARDNFTPQMTFIDDGSPANNQRDGYPPLTGGTSFTQVCDCSYGVPGHFSVPLKEIENDVWSPPIAWDLPGTEDDDADQALLRFDLWFHTTSQSNTSTSVWVRSSDDDGTTWTWWQRVDVLYHGILANGYHTLEYDVTEQLLPDLTHLQVSFKVENYLSGHLEDHTTPAPWFDNVEVVKTREPTAVTSPSRKLLELRSVEPNPFNPATEIVLYVGREATYRVTVYNLRGEQVRRLHDGVLTRGPHRLRWRGLDDGGRAMASGVYVVRAEGDGLNESTKLTLVR